MSGVLITLLITLGGGGLLIGAELVGRRRRRAPQRALERATPIAIAAMPPSDPTKITGVVGVRDSLITSPVGGHPCIGFRTVIQLASSGGWMDLVKREECRSFFLADETGTVVVDGPFVLALDVDDGAWAIMPPSVYTLLEDTAKDETAWVNPDVSRHFLLQLVRGGRELRFQEALLKPGDRINVRGRPTMELDPAGRGSYRDPPMLNHIRGSEKDPVIIADAEEPAV